MQRVTKDVFYVFYSTVWDAYYSEKEEDRILTLIADSFGVADLCALADVHHKLAAEQITSLAECRSYLMSTLYLPSVSDIYRNALSALLEYLTEKERASYSGRTPVYRSRAEWIRALYGADCSPTLRMQRAFRAYACGENAAAIADFNRMSDTDPHADAYVACIALESEDYETALRSIYRCSLIYCSDTGTWISEPDDWMRRAEALCCRHLTKAEIEKIREDAAGSRKRGTIGFMPQ